MKHPRSLALVSLTLGALLGTGCDTTSKIDLGRVVVSGRDGWQHPERVVDSLRIGPGDRVAEIGAGSGYWLPWLSRAVGPEGRVYAVEVQEQLVEDLRARVQREGLGNVEVVFGRYEDPLLPDAGIDFALTSLTYHHIEDRVAYFSALRADLTPTGQVVHLDGRDDVPIPVRWLMTSGHWTNAGEMNEEMAAAGYVRVADFDFLPMETLQVFEPTSTDHP